MHNNEAIIAVSVAVVLLLSGLVIYFSTFGAAATRSAEADFAKIEASIEKLLARAGEIRGSAGPSLKVDAVGGEGDAAAEGAGGEGASAGSAGAAPSGDLAKIKSELEEKRKEIDALKAKMNDPKNDSTPELLAKIKNLEDRLAEYEIIEDDIADLSHYKEENARLKTKLKEFGVEDDPASEPAATAVAVEDPRVAEATAALDAAPEAVPDVTSEVVASAEATTSVEVPAAEPAPTTDVAAEAPAPAADAPQAEVVAAPEVPTSVEPSKPPATEGETSSDIFAEFGDADGGENADPLAELGDIDTNKMLAEIEGLSAEGASADVLKETPDVDKMAAEAEGMDKKS